MTAGFADVHFFTQISFLLPFFIRRELPFREEDGALIHVGKWSERKGRKDGGRQAVGEVVAGGIPSVCGMHCMPSITSCSSAPSFLCLPFCLLFRLPLRHNIHIHMHGMQLQAKRREDERMDGEAAAASASTIRVSRPLYDSHTTSAFSAS